MRNLDAAFKISLLFSLLSLAACANYTPQQLRAEPYEKGSFTVPLSLKMTLQNFLNRIKQCYIYRHEYASLNLIEVAQGQKYTIEISNWVYADIAKLSVDIERKEKETEVTYYRKSDFGNYETSFRDQMINFANDTGAFCNNW